MMSTRMSRSLLLVIGLHQSEPSGGAGGWTGGQVGGVKLGGKCHSCLVPDFPSVKFSEALAASILVLSLSLV